MLLHEFENVCICVGDDETMFEDVDGRPDVEVLRSVEQGLSRTTAWLCNTTSLEETTSEESGILDRRFKDRHQVIGQTITDDKSTTFVFGPSRILQEHDSSSSPSPSSIIDYDYDYYDDNGDDDVDDDGKEWVGIQ